MTLRLTVTLCVGDSESVTLAVKLKVPAVVGVPVMAPEEAFRLNPAGRLPLDTVHVYCVKPPVAARVWL